jgi:tetratricopeptide (TPR) repeat protein
MRDTKQLEEAISLFHGDDSVPVRALDLDAFLDLTEGSDISPGQRLRSLAIALERRATRQRKWEDLHLIYQKAAELAPDHATVFHSWGISATEWLDPWRTPEMSSRVQIASEGERAFLKALDLAPRNSHIAHSLGLLYYQHPLGETNEELWLERAITWFGHAAEWENDRYSVIAQLYLAHCYHDRKDWPRAIAAYEKVAQARLAQEWPRWRAVKCREQIAHCYALSGQADEAIRLFSSFLEEVEPMDASTSRDWVINLDELVDAVTNHLNDPTLRRRTQEVARRLGYTKRYPRLFMEVVSGEV